MLPGFSTWNTSKNFKIFHKNKNNLYLYCINNCLITFIDFVINIFFFLFFLFFLFFFFIFFIFFIFFYSFLFIFFGVF